MGFNQTWVWLQNIFITVKLCCLLSVQSKRELLHRGNSISIHQPTTYIWISVPTRPVHVLKTQFLCLTPSLTLNCICISTWNRPFFLSTSTGCKQHPSSHSRSPMWESPHFRSVTAPFRMPLPHHSQDWHKAGKEGKPQRGEGTLPSQSGGFNFSLSFSVAKI